MNIKNYKLKKSKEELQEYFKFKRRGGKVASKKLYTRKQKHKTMPE